MIITLVASCFLGALPPVDLRAVCLVRAISIQIQLKLQQKELRKKSNNRKVTQINK